MSYIALARKYRPRRLSELRGQENLVETLTNAIESGRIYHAFIFTGTRGIGKTTTARILALSLNCIGKDGKGNETPEACLECKNCQDILNFSHPDVIEIDAASHTGVDFAREIIDSSKYPPMSARYKVFIIDEVHMLSKSAFNALLKTLEEPNKFVKFIFATTEFNKIPITIVSRCQKFFLPNLTNEKIFENLIEVANKEKLDYDEEALRKISILAKGSVRDSLSILDQVISLSNEKIDLKTVEEINDINGNIAAQKIIDLVIADKANEACEVATGFIQSGYGIKALLLAMMEIVSNFAKSAIFNNNTEIPVHAIDRFYQIIAKSIETADVINDPNMLYFVIMRLKFIKSAPSLEQIAKFAIEEQKSG